MNASNEVYAWEIVVTDQAGIDLREEVRSRYAQAATEDHLTKADRAAAGSHVGCIAGVLSRKQYLDGLAAVGFADPEVTFTTGAAPGMHSAIIRAVKPKA